MEQAIDQANDCLIRQIEDSFENPVIDLPGQRFSVFLF